MDDLDIVGSPAPPWFTGRLEQLRLQALDPAPLVVLYARTSREYLAEWLDAHLPAEIGLGDEFRLRIRRRKTPEENAYPDLVIGGYAILLREPGRWTATFKAEFFQPILVFRAAPIHSDRCEITLFRTPDPRVQPLIDSLLRAIARAWPETAKAVAPLVASANASPAAEPRSVPEQAARAPESQPLPRARIPVDPETLRQWRQMWPTIQAQRRLGKTITAISMGFSLNKEHTGPWSVSTVKRIIRAAEDGLLDESDDSSEAGPPF